MSEGIPTLEVGFAIAFGDSFAEMAHLNGVIDQATANALKEFALIERATKGAFDMSGATARMSSFGVAATRDLNNVAASTNRAEKAAEAMIRQLDRQAATFGKSASEIRQMDAELKAVAAESRGLTEVATRLRTASASMRQLEQDAKRLPGPTNAARASMQNLGFQVQDFAVQIVGGTSAIRAFAMQAPQAAGALTGFGGVLGRVGGFLAGPWGLALTVGTTLLAGFAAESLETSDALEKVKFASSAVGDAQSILGGVLDTTTGKINNQSGALMGLARAQLAVARVQAQQRMADARSAMGDAGKLGFGDGLYGAFSSKKTLMGSRITQQLMASQLAGAATSKDVLKSLEDLNKAGLVSAEVFGKAASAAANFAVEGENMKVYESAQRILDGVGTAMDKSLILKAPKATKSLKETNAALREMLELAKWIADTRTEAYGNAQKLADEMIKRQREEWGKDDQGLEGLGINKADREAEALKQAAIDNARDALAAYMADLDKVSKQVDEVAGNMRHAFGTVGGAIGDVITVLDEYGKRQKEIDKERDLGGADAKRLGELRKQEIGNQLGGMIALTGAAKGLFKEHSKGYQAMAAAEKALTIIQLARTAIDVAGGAAKMFATLGPFAFPAVAAMLGVMASLGFGGGGSAGSAPKANDGTGTVFGDASAKSDSIKRSIDSLKGVDTLMLGTSREMLASLRSIDSQIGGFASLVLRAGNVDASAGVNTGFATDTTGKLLSGIVDPLGILSKIPIIGGVFGAIKGIIKGLFGTKTSVIGSGLFGDPQALGGILSDGFNASYYSDIKKKKKFFGITTSTKYSTQYSDADPGLENQFTLILREFDKAILAAAGPLGAATGDIQQRLNSFVVNIGKIDLKDLTGEQIQEKLNAVFGAAADDMAKAAFPGMEKFQKVGEGLFETLVRVASTVETVTSSLGLLGSTSIGLTTDLKMSLADQFESVSALSDAVSGYFTAYYTKEEQAAARNAQMGKVFDSIGLTMPATLAAFRALVEAQNLTTAAGQATYATLLQLAPAFADLQAAMNGAKSAADIMAERQDLERKLLELKGDTAAIRALDLANLDASNRALQQQIWALQDAQEAAKAADELRQAWTSVGDSIMDEVKRIRGLSDPTGSSSFASLMGQFNAATLSARGGDQDAAKLLPGLSQSLLQSASLSATSRQELERIQAQTAASLTATYGALSGLMTGGTSTSATLAAAATTAQASAATSANDNNPATMAAEIRALREELAGMRNDINTGQAAIASNTGAMKKHLDNVTQQSGGDAISTVAAA